MSYGFFLSPLCLCDCLLLYLTLSLLGTPSYAWLIDPFGHSSTTPLLYARAGFKGTVLNRIHYRLREELKLSKMFEFHWKPQWPHSDGHDKVREGDGRERERERGKNGAQRDNERRIERIYLFSFSLSLP